MSFFNADEIRALLGGRWLTTPNPDAPKPDGASIDSRHLSPGQVFFALRGARLDGHAFAHAAIDAGASLVVADHSASIPHRPGPSPPGPGGLLIVPDARAALGHLASAWRNRLQHAGCVVIGVTGSNGKTTTVRLIHAALSLALPGVRPPKSFNNDIGLPLSLLAVPLSARFAVVELGINAPGEMDRLVEIARPQAAVITSIGRAHLEALGSIAGVAHEKARILRGPELSGADRALAVLPSAVPELDPLTPTPTPAQGPGIELVRVGPPPGHPVESVHQARGLTSFTFRGERYTVPLEGAHNATNAAMAAAVATWMGLSPDQIRAGLLAVEPPEMRLNISTLRLHPAAHPDPAVHPEHPVVLIDDAYNANPESVRAALDVLARHTPKPGGRRLAVLGDMLELGDAGPALHRELGDEIARADSAHLVVAVGRLMAFTAQALTQSPARAWPPDRVHPVPLLDDASAARVAALVRPGDVVLLKASRSIGLERVAAAIRARAARPDARPQTA